MLKKSLISRLIPTLISVVLAAASLCVTSSVHAQTPTCPNVHVWYTLNNDSGSSWAIQVAGLYENNISFVDENCAPINLDNKVIIIPGLARYFGMKVNSDTGFYATYSFMGVKVPNSSSVNAQIPKGVPACAFVVAPYGPGQMDRVDWKTNNADCYAQNLGTELHFK